MIVPNGSLSGFYRALVVSAADPAKQGRVKVRIPDIMVDKGWGTGVWCENGIWARPANNWIGGRNIYDTKGSRCSHTDAWYQGSCMPPPKGSHVFIFFEKGDPSHPFYFAAADYGQTKVLPENRVGPQWWNKWTPIKTREGRAFVISDDPYDARVELTGKKRQIHNTPDGDTQSVFDIDGNQSVILIDERPSHEKIFVKDYRGNYIKMIQDENGINDQLHVFFKDDIHIETLKNIYIQAHENIHITANQNIYITALQNMHIKVTQEFREMAHLINRYSETNDNRLVEIDINDSANHDCARNAANIVRDMAATMCSRNSSGTIADGAAGSMSIMAGGVMSVLGSGGTFVDGPTVAIENGSAPIPPSSGIIPATMAVKATLPKPDDSRHFTASDDGWAPTVGDENPQYQCHNKFWKPHYKWSPKSQCDNSVTNIGGGGCNGNNEAPPTSSDDNNSSPSNPAIPPSSGSNIDPKPNPISTQEQQTAAPTSNNPVSILNTINNVLSDLPEKIAETVPKILDTVNNITDAIKDNICNITQNTSNEIKDIINDLNDTIDDTTQQSVKNAILNVATNVSDCKCEDIFDDIVTANPIKVDVTTELSNMYDDIRERIDGETDLNIISENVKQSIDMFKNDIIAKVVSDITQCVINNLQSIADKLEEDFSKYDNATEKCLNEIKEKFTKDVVNQINDNAKDALKTAELDYELEYDDASESVEQMYVKFKNDYINDIDLSDSIFRETIQEILSDITDQTPDYTTNISNSYIDNTINIFNNEELEDDIAKALSDPSIDVADYISNIIKTKILDTISDISHTVNTDLIKTIVCSGIKDVDNELDSKIDPLVKINDAFNECLVKPLNTLTQNGLIDNILDISNPMEDINVPNISTTDVPDLPETIQKTILDSLPTPTDILDYVTSNLDDNINDYVDKVTDNVLEPIDSIMDKMMGPIKDTVNNTIPSLQDMIDPNDLTIDYGTLSGWDPKTKTFDQLVFENVCALTDRISQRLMDSIENIIKNTIEISTSPKINDPRLATSNFINTIVYSITKDCLNEKFVTESLNDGILDVVNNYFNDRDVTDYEKCNTLVNSTCEDISKFDVRDKLKENLDYDPNDDLDELINHKLNELSDNLNECKTGDETIPNSIKDGVDDIIKPLTDIQKYSDILKNVLSKHLNTTIGEKFNPLIPGILSNIKDDISSELCKNISNDVKNHVGDKLNELKTMCEDKDPNDWTTDEILHANTLMDNVNNYYDVLNDINSYLNSEPIDIIDTIMDNTKEDIENDLPTTNTYKNDIMNYIRDASNALCSNIKDTCKQNIVLTDNIEDNEFDRNLDLTKIYTIPGVKSSKCKCIPTADDPESVWCDPEIIGGCGCIYEYTLFLKHKFYNPLLPILVNDSIKTTGLSLNPILSNLKDTDYKFHDQEIISDYNRLIDDIYNDRDTDLTNNKYLVRIDEFMTTCDAFDITCIVNLLDFTYQSYRWLEDVPNMDKYTHDMVDEKFIRFMTLIVKYIYYDRNDNRRSCRIILNLGNGSFINPDDVNNEKYNIYPNCGFIRELIMKLVYNCKISSNYMSITANKDNNLYYYNPYSEFKCYDDGVQHELKDYEICIRDYVDDKTNGMDDSIIYNDENNIESGYANFYTQSSERSYPLSYMYDLMEWCSIVVDNETILEKYTMPNGEIDSNIMNVIFTPNARKVMRYFYKGHENYFKYKDLIFDPDTGDVEE